MISSVRHLVAVVILPQIVRGLSGEVQTVTASIESLPYGTATRPGHLWRNATGDYFAAEFAKGSLVAFWNTALELPGFLKTLSSTGLMVDSESEKPRVRMFGSSGTEVEGALTHRDQVLERFGKEQIERAVISNGSGCRVLWRQAIRRFHDLDIVGSDVTAISRPADVHLTKILAMESGPRTFLVDAACKITIRTEGRAREYPL